MHPSQDVIDFLDSVKQDVFSEANESNEAKMQYQLSALQIIWDRTISHQDENKQINLNDLLVSTSKELSKKAHLIEISEIRKAMHSQATFLEKIAQKWSECKKESPFQSVIDPFEFLDQIRQNCDRDMATLTAIWMIEEILNTSNVPSMIDVANWCEKLADNLNSYQAEWAAIAKVKRLIIDALGLIRGEWLSKQVQANELNKVKSNKFEYVFEERRGKGQPHQIWLNHRFVIGFFDEDECKETLHNMNNAIESAN